MSETIRAKKADIVVGDKTVEVFQLPNGEYRLSQTQVAAAVGNGEHSFRQFLASKSPQALPYKGFKSDKVPVESSRKPINAIPIRLASAYWQKEANAGNSEAMSLSSASIREMIERRADDAFGVERSEQERNELFAERRFEDLGLPTEDFYDLEAYAQEPGFYSEETYKSIRPLLNSDYKNPVFGMTEDEFRDDLASLSSRTDKWRLKVEDELEFPFSGEREYSYPDLISDVFLCSADLNGEQQKVVYIFECKNPIVRRIDIKQCIYERKYLEATREKYDTEHVFLFFVAPFKGEPKAYNYINELLDPQDKEYVRIISVQEMADFLKSQIATTNSKMKGAITKRYRKLSDYQVPKFPNNLFGENSL